MFDYSAQLKDPRWRKKREEILGRDKYQCQRCNPPAHELDYYDAYADGRLEVHHKRYIAGRMAWEYDNEDLITLCSACHGVHHMREAVDHSNRTGFQTGANVLDSIMAGIL